MKTEDIVEKIWQQVNPTIFASRQDFVSGLEGWDIVPRDIDGSTIGATLTRGPEFHFVTFGLRKTFPSSLISECLQPILDKHGFVVTRTPKDDIRQRRFNALIGFRVMSEDEYYVNFHMDQLHLHRGKSCLQ